MEKKQAILVPMIALRGMSIFPGMAISFPAGRQKSLDALQAAEENGKEIFLVTQKDPVIPDPSRNDLYDIGVLAEVKQVLKLPRQSDTCCGGGEKPRQTFEYPCEKLRLCRNYDHCAGF